MPRSDYIRMARRVAQQVGVPWPLFGALVDSESGWNPEAKSPAGAIGLGQLMPGTAQGLGVDPWNPEQNLTGAARYLKTQLEAFGNPELALAAYNAGPGAVRKYGGIPPYEETQKYVQTVLGRRSRYSGGAFSPPGMAGAPTGAPSLPVAPQGQQSVRRQQAMRLLSNATSKDFDPVAALQDLVQIKRRAEQEMPERDTGPPLPGVIDATAAGTPSEQFIPPEQVNGLVPILPTPMGEGSEFAMPDNEGAPSAKGGRYHAAKDWFGDAHTPVFSPVNGKVVEVKATRGNSGQVYGGVVKVRASNGMVFVMRHIDPSKLKVGQKVQAGTPVGRITAWTDGSPHVHVEVWKTLAGGYKFENMLDPGKVFGQLGRKAA